MNTIDKIFTIFAILLFGVISSYMVFGWSEPTGSMPSSFKAPINTTIEDQDVAEGKPVVDNLDSDKVDGFDAADLLSASTTSTGSGLYLIMANFAKNNISLDFPDCPTGFDVVLEDGFVQYQSDTNVSGGYYTGTYLYYDSRVLIDGQYLPLRFVVYQNTQNATCYKLGYQYFNSTSSYFNIPITCVGDCSSCSDAASVSITYSVCKRDPTASTFQGGEISVPTISTLTTTRLISSVPYMGRLQIASTIDNGGENVDLELYIDDVLIDSEEVTSSYSYLYELAPENYTSNVKIIVTNSAGNDQDDTDVFVGTLGGGMYIESDCTTAGGEVYTIQAGQRVCKFTQSSWTCPSGWSAYYSWSTTAASSACGSGYHTFSNAGVESCATYNSLGYYSATYYASVVERGCY